MALLPNLRKSFINIFKIEYYSIYRRNFCVTSSFWSNRFTRPGTYKKKEKHFVEKDKVPKNYELIYKAPMESYITWATHVSTLTASGIGAAAMYNFICEVPLTEAIDMGLLIQSEDIYFFAAGFLAINTVLRLVVAIFPLRIYKDQRKYLAVYHSSIPFTVTHHNFERGQVRAISYRLSPWNNITYKLGKKTSLLLVDYFKTPSEFNEMHDIDLKK